MLLRLALSVVAIAVTAAAASAADLPAGTKLGEIFAAPPQGRHTDKRGGNPFAAIFPEVANSPRVPGYYGRPGDFYYRTYYGTRPDVIYNRLPYACWWSGSC